MSNNGISRLIAVTQLKVNNANDQAMAGAQKQAAIIGQQKSLRGVQRKFDEHTRTELQGALQELQTILTAFRKTLSLPAAALLDQRVEWAAQHRQ